MDRNNNVSTPKKDSPDKALLGSSTIVYIIMLSVGAMIAYYCHGTLGKYLLIESPSLLGKYLCVALLGSGVLIVLNLLFEEYFASYKSLKEALVELLGPYSILMLIYLSFISAFGEEVLFRGAIQPYLGLFVTSLIFGLIHIGPGNRISSWSLWALLAGLLLGWMYKQLGNLWPSIMCHFTVNMVSMTRIKIAYRKTMALKETSSQSITDNASSKGRGL
ncbi:MAG: CPBP family intramembrane metalloprotease [Oligoflexales bacterium]|nr:CPBP family intramembrane metalloprotease [Oligoflexales bacterium]